MLVISRKKEQKIIVADDIEITILEIGRNRVRFGIKAPKCIPIQTRLPDNALRTDAAQPLEKEGLTSSFDCLPAAAGDRKRR